MQGFTGIDVVIGIGAALIAIYIAGYRTRQSIEAVRLEIRDTTHSTSQSLMKQETLLESLKKQIEIVKAEKLALRSTLLLVLDHLHNAKLINAKELSKMIAGTFQTPIERILAKLDSGNPISHKDAERLRKYFERVQAGEELSSTEAEDFNKLSQLVVDDYPENTGAQLLRILGLIAMGAAAGFIGAWLYEALKGEK